MHVTVQNGQVNPRPVAGNVDETVTLAPGENVLEFRAINDGALAGYEEFESARRAVVIDFQPKPAPRISLVTIVPLAHPQTEASPGARIDIEPGRPTIVAAGRVRVRGRITGDESLLAARIGERALTKFQPAVGKAFTIDEIVTLKPGDQELRFRAKSANSAEAEARLTITYRPPLPLLMLTDPDPDLALTEGKDDPTVEVRGPLALPEGVPAFDLQPFAVIVRVTNGGRLVAQAGGDTITVPSSRLTDPQRLYPAGVLAAKISLHPGDNRIDVTVRNHWRTVTAVERHVFYRRPPRIVGPLKTPAAGAKPFTDVIADVESASALTRVECNGREYPVDKVAVRVHDSTWRISLSQVPLKPGRNTIRLMVSNRDGPCLKNGVAEISVERAKLQPPPKVELLNRPQGAVKNAEFTAQFDVRSTGSRVQRVELRKAARCSRRLRLRDRRKTGRIDLTPRAESGRSFSTRGRTDFGWWR